MSNNTNVLEGMACPRCGSEEPFIMNMVGSFKVFDDGTKDMYDTEWDGASACVCCNCTFDGKAIDFLRGHLVNINFAGAVAARVKADPNDADAWADALQAAISALTTEQIAAGVAFTDHEVLVGTTVQS